MTYRVSDRETVVMIADPPWPHANGSRTNSGKSPKYRLMNLREIAALAPTVSNIAGNDAVLYLWTTAPHLPGAIHVMTTWGFRYRSFHVWRKTRMACGFWARSNGELVLVGERGRPAAPPASRLLGTLLDGEPLHGVHSSKPLFLHEMVERLWPNALKYELFAREQREGWHCVGIELGHRITPEGIMEACS